MKIFFGEKGGKDTKEAELLFVEIVGGRIFLTAESEKERFDVWWEKKLPWIQDRQVSCPKCGFMTRYKGRNHTCPDCKKTYEIELADG